MDRGDLRDLMIQRLRKDQDDRCKGGSDIETGRDQKLDSQRVLTTQGMSSFSRLETEHLRAWEQRAVGEHDILSPESLV
jgi:hypothetical protein